MIQQKNISLLTKDGCYLPPRESIKVIEPSDSLKAFKLEVSASPEKESNRKRKKRSIDREVEFASSTPNNPKRSKNKNSILQVEEQISKRETKTFHSDIVGEISRVKELSVNTTTTTNDKTCSTSHYPKLSKKKNSILNLEEQASNQESNILQNEPDDEEVSTVKELSVNKTGSYHSLNEKQTTHKGSISGNHIFLQEEGLEPQGVTTTDKKKRQSSKVLSIISFRCPLLELDPNNVRVFKLPRKSVPIEIIENIVIPAPQSATTSSQEDVSQSVNEKPGQENAAQAAISSSRPASPAPPNKSLSLTKESPLKDKPSFELPSIAEQSVDLDSDDDVMVLDDTNPEDSDSDVQTVPLKDGFNEIIADMLQNAAPLKDLPNIGDTVIFKLPRSKGVALSPKTENIAGTCSYINRRTKIISISLIGE